MADIKCPECGKENDELAKECKFCGALLNLPLDEQEKKSKPESVDDFLASLRQTGVPSPEIPEPDIEAEPAKQETEPNQDISDFISRLRDFTIEQEVEMGSSPEAAEDSLPDWIKELDSWQPTPIVPETEDLLAALSDEPVFSLDDNLTPQWLEAAEEKTPIAESAEIPGENITEDLEAEKLSDWLSAQKEEQTQSEETGLEEIENQLGEPLIELPPAFEELAAMENLRARHGHPAGQETPPFENEPVEQTGISPEEEKTPEEPEITPIERVETPEETIIPAEDAKLPSETEAVIEEVEAPAQTAAPFYETEAPEVITAPAEEAELPSEVEAVIEEAEAPAQTAAPFYETEAPEETLIPLEEVEITEETVIPLHEAETAEGEAIPLGEPLTAEQVSPDWIPREEEIEIEENIPVQVHPEYPGEEDILPPFEGENLNEWLGDLRAKSYPLEEEISGQPESVERVSPEWLPDEKQVESGASVPPLISHAEYPGEEDILPPAGEESLNEWLGDLQAEKFPQVFETSASETTEEPSNTTPPFVSGDLDAWMKTLPQAGEGQEQGTEEEGSPEPAETLPGWMQNIEPTGRAGEQPGEVQPEETQTETGIPAWLAALQPLDEYLSETAKPADTGEIEQTGPLAGIPGILPVFEASVFFRKPPLYSSQVIVSDQQHANAVKLENILREEKQAAKKKRPDRKAPHELLRAIVGILLVGVMLLPLLGIIPPLAGVPTDNAGTTGAGAFLAAMDALPVESTVLVAVEYSPGYDDELGTAARSTLEMLMKRGAHIAVVSTHSSGLILAEDLKNDVLAANPDLQQQYNQRDWFINLGYLPGETLSLQELASDPRQAAQYGISSGLENRLVWDSAGLIGIQSLDDFSMLVLIADTIETGRSWIEQVQPVIRNVPFLVVSSAQAAPMLQPYAASGQIQGMVSGMAGGYTLQKSSPLSATDGSEKWTAYQFGVAAVILFILIGMITEWIRSSRSRKQMDQEVS